MIGNKGILFRKGTIEKFSIFLEVYLCSNFREIMEV